MCIRAGKQFTAYIYVLIGVLGLSVFFFPVLGRLFHVQDVWLPPHLIHTAPLMYQKGWFMLGMAAWGAYFFIALIYVALGEKDEAFRWLEAAYGPPNHPYLPWIGYSPDFTPLRDDPRFDDLLRRMNFPE